MGCGDCSKKVAGLQQQILELRSVLDELRSEYLSLAGDFDRLSGIVDGEADDDEEGEEALEEGQD